MKAKNINYRDVFRDMPQLRHDVDASKSDVLDYIMHKLECDLEQAARVFNIIRHPRRRIIVFNRSSATWSGEEKLDAIGELRWIRKRLVEQEKEIADLIAAVFGKKA